MDKKWWKLNSGKAGLQTVTAGTQRIIKSCRYTEFYVNMVPTGTSRHLTQIPPDIRIRGVAPQTIWVLVWISVREKRFWLDGSNLFG